MMGKNQDHTGLWREEREPEETHGGWPQFPRELGHKTMESGLATVVSVLGNLQGMNERIGKQ